MASPPLLSFDELVAPIPGANPAGEKYLPNEVQEKLEKGRQEEDPEEPERKPDWPGIVRVATETLTSTSKNLEVAARLTEALVKLHGFAGLRDGLHLMRDLLDQAWERLIPALSEEGDTEEDIAFNLERRIARLNWLDPPDDTSGSRFPITVRMVPIIVSSVGKYSWQDWRRVQDGKGEITQEEFDKAVEAAKVETCKGILEDMDACAEEITLLVRQMDARFSGTAPSYNRVRMALEESRGLLREILKRKSPGDDPESDTPGEAEVATEGSDHGKPAATRSMKSRADVYRQLKQAADLLRQLEPHSPVPYLVQRAVDLGDLPFPLLLKRLVRDANVLNEMNREFDLKLDEASGPSS